MEFSGSSLRSRKPPGKSSDLHSTFVIHNDDEQLGKSTNPNEEPNIFATMLRKDDPADEEDDGESLPPLLKRIPKDFDNLCDVSGPISGTMIVKSDRNHSPYSRKPPQFSHRGNDDNLSTFVVRSTVKKDRERELSISGTVSRTVVRRTSGGGGASTMSRAVASMQASNSQEEERKLRKQTSKVSSSSIPDIVTREDPSTKYELL